MTALPVSALPVVAAPSPAALPAPIAAPAPAAAKPLPRPQPPVAVVSPRSAQPVATPRDAVPRPAAALAIRQTVREPVNDFLDPERLGAVIHPLSLPRAAAEEDPTVPCRPMVRHPVPVLWILDDGSTTGETLRVRRTPFLIGRRQGQLRIPHDELISDSHAEILWKDRKWIVRDAHSQSGLFVRIGNTPIAPGQQLRLGHRIYQFEEPGQLVLAEGGVRHRFRAKSDDVWIGRDPGPEGLRLPEDVAVSPRHARLFRDASGEWHLEDTASANGTWLRVDDITVENTIEFFLGEQRFRLEVPLVASER